LFWNKKLLEVAQVVNRPEANPVTQQTMSKHKKILQRNDEAGGNFSRLWFDTTARVTEGHQA